MPRQTCHICKTEFEARRHNALCCSQPCRQKAYKQKPAVLPDRLCLACGVPFTPKRLSSSCCSPACQAKRWATANVEHVRAWAREWNRAKVRTKRPKARTCAHCDKPIPDEATARRAYCSKACVTIARRERDPQREAARVQAWKDANRDKVVAHDAKRRALHEKAAGWSYTTAEHIRWRWEMWGGLCWVCGVPACATDHVIPLNAGGAHWPSNLRPICTSCNSKRKKSRPAICGVIA